MYRGTLAVLILVILGGVVSCQSADPTPTTMPPLPTSQPQPTQQLAPGHWGSAGLTTADAADLLARTLALGPMGNRSFFADPNRFPILDEGEAPLPLPESEVLSFYYMTRQELAEAAEARGEPFWFLNIRPVKRVGDKVTVEVYNDAVFPPGPQYHAMGSGVIVDFTQGPDGGWVQREVRSWIE